MEEGKEHQHIWWEKEERDIEHPISWIQILGNTWHNPFKNRSGKTFKVYLV